MKNILSYMEWRGDLSLKSFPLNEVDIAVLSRLAYIDFNGIVSSSFEEKISAGDAADRFLSLPDAVNRIYRGSDLAMLKKISSSPRFSNLLLCGYISQWDENAEKQFAAISITVDSHTVCISYRGTDNTLLGWKEDFNMGFSCPVPSQTAAVDYLSRASSVLRGRIIVTGHSKGGNLAMYASAFCRPGIQRRIVKVYNFDGPGFEESIINSEGYRNVKNKIMAFIPQSSVVGMLLFHGEEFKVIRSLEKPGLPQHNLYSWEVIRDSFNELEEVTMHSKFVDETLKSWVGSMEPSQREAFVNIMYELICDTGARTLDDLGNRRPEKLISFLSSLKELDEESKNIISDSITLLMESARKAKHDKKIPLY